MYRQEKKNLSQFIEVIPCHYEKGLKNINLDSKNIDGSCKGIIIRIIKIITN